MKSNYNFNPLVAMVCIFALVFTLVAPVPASALSFKGKTKAAATPVALGWDNVLRLKEGDRILVILFSSKMYRGKVEKIEGDSLGISLGRKKGSMMISKAEVQTVALDKRYTANVWGGTLLAVGGGLVTGSFEDSTGRIPCEVNGQYGTCDPSAVINKYYRIIGGSAAGAGAVIMAVAGKPKFVYHADAPPAEAPAK